MKITRTKWVQSFLWLLQHAYHSSTVWPRRAQRPDSKRQQVESLQADCCLCKTRIRPCGESCHKMENHNRMYYMQPNTEEMRHIVCTATEWKRKRAHGGKCLRMTGFVSTEAHSHPTIYITCQNSLWRIPSTHFLTRKQKKNHIWKFIRVGS